MNLPASYPSFMEQREPDLKLIGLLPFARGGVLAATWLEDFPKIEAAVESTAHNALVVFDLRDVEYLGYSYAKGTIRKLLMRRNRGELGERRLFLLGPTKYSFLEGTERALADQNCFMYMFESPADFARRGVLIGAKARGNHDRVGNVLEPTFHMLLTKRSVTTGEAATLLDTTPQNMKNRFDRLVEMGIVVRDKATSPTGGHEWSNRIW